MSINRADEDGAGTHGGMLPRHKKNERTLFTATWVPLQRIVLSEVSQKEKDTHHVLSRTCGL